MQTFCSSCDFPFNSDDVQHRARSSVNTKWKLNISRAVVNIRHGSFVSFCVFPDCQRRSPQTLVKSLFFHDDDSIFSNPVCCVSHTPERIGRRWLNLPSLSLSAQARRQTAGIFLMSVSQLDHSFLSHHFPHGTNAHVIEAGICPSLWSQQPFGGWRASASVLPGFPRVQAFPAVFKLTPNLLSVATY